MEPQPFETETRYNKPLMLQMLAIVILLIFAMMDDIAWISGSSDAFNAELTMTSAEIKYSLPFPLFTETKTWSDHCIGLRRLFTGARFDTQPVGEQCWNFAETSTFISICAILAGVVLLISSLVVGLRGRLGHYQHFMRSVQVFLSLLSFSLAGFSVVILKTWLEFQSLSDKERLFLVGAIDDYHYAAGFYILLSACIVSFACGIQHLYCPLERRIAVEPEPEEVYVDKLDV